MIDSHGYCKITDLGIAKYWQEKNYFENSGTPGYMAPEVLLSKNHSYTADYYGLGVLAYELFVRKRPFRGKKRKILKSQILTKEARIPETIN